MRYTSAIVLVIIGVIGMAGARTRSTQNPIATTVRILPRGYMRIEITNTSKTSITALAIVGIRTWQAQGISVRSVRFFDSVLNPYGHPQIAAGESYDFDVFGPNPPPEQLTRAVNLEAALFADGSTWGDPEWVAALVDRRSSALKYNNEALNAVDAAVMAGSSEEDLSQRLRQLRSDEMHAASSTAERQMADISFDEPLFELQDAERAAGAVPSLSETFAGVRARLQFRISRLRSESGPATN